MRSTVKDSDWIKHSFMTTTRDVTGNYDRKVRILSTASYKYTNSQLGGSFAINPWPQFTSLADTRPVSAFNGQPAIKMGRYFSEAIDDNQQVVNFRLGVPKFNSLKRFFGDFYSHEANVLARQARGTSLFFQAGRVAGGVISIALSPIILAGKAIRFFMDMPASRYYYLKPAMPLYWNAVTSVVNTIAVNMGVIPRIFPDEQKQMSDGAEWTKEQIASLHKLLPGVINESGSIDIYAISTRAQRLANQYNTELETALSEERIANGGVGTRIKEFISNNWNPILAAGNLVTAGYRTIGELMDKYLGTQDGSVKDTAGNAATFETDSRDQSWVEAMGEYFEGERKMGADFVTFRVDHTGVQTESFSNQTGEPGIATTLNGMSNSNREKRFSAMDGNISDDPLSKAIGATIGSAKDFIMGVSEQMSVSGFAALAGNAFVDIPDVWQGSSSEVGGITLNIPLRAPYGNAFSRLQNLIVPMAALMAMALPLSSGKQSFTSPFILEMYSEGRCQCSLGMVRDLTFTRGAGETGWVRGSRFMAVDAQLSIIDLSKNVHMPISPNFTLGNAIIQGAVNVATGATAVVAGAAGVSQQTIDDTQSAIGAALMPSTFDTDNKYTSLMAVYGSLPMEAQVNTWRKFKLRATQQAVAFENYTSPAHLVQWAMGGIAGDIIKAVSTVTDRP